MESGRQGDKGTRRRGDKGTRNFLLLVSPSPCPLVLIPHSPLVNLRLRCLSPRVQKIEVASLIGLRDVSAEERAEAALVMRRRRRPFGATPSQLFFADQQIQFSSRHVHFDQIPVARERQRPAYITFGRDVKHTGAV